MAGNGCVCLIRSWWRKAMERTILLVDDNKFIVEGLRAILMKKGYQILVSNNGLEALELLGSTIPDLILLDISMEPIDGWETLERARCRPGCAQIPVIIFSARKNLGEEARKNNLRVFEILSKPINTGFLVDAIERALAGRLTSGPEEIKPGTSAFHINIGFEKHISED